MAANKFKVPSSSLPELKKIISGYAHLETNVDLSSLSKLVSIGNTTISRNNPFLAEVGVIEQGKTKNVTPIGKRLGRAIEHKRSDEIREAWQEIIRNSEFLSKLVSTVRIRGGMTESELGSHILFAADLKKTKEANTGANTIIAILKEAALLEESNGKLIVSTSADVTETRLDDGLQSMTADNLGIPSNTQIPLRQAPPSAKQSSASNLITPTIVINIQLQLPETESVSVYENLFMALRKHLLVSEEEANA